MQNILTLAALAAVLALPGAMAAVGTDDILGPIATVVPVTPVPLPATPAAPSLYVTEDGNLWQESNGFDGLQMEPVVDEQGNQVAAADTRIAGTADLPALPF